MLPADRPVAHGVNAEVPVYRQIMVPLDGSRFAESALPSALTLSRLTGADVRLVMVEEPIPAFSYGADDDDVRQWTGRYLDRVVHRASGRTGGALTYDVVEGGVVEALEAEAESCHADIVVMATHGRGILTRSWLGSVADAFLQHTSWPVLMVRPKEEQAPDVAEDVSFAKILVPLDGFDPSESVLGHAIDFGTLFGASYHLVRIVQFTLDIVSPYLPTSFMMDPGLMDDARADATEYLEGHAGRMRAKGLEVSVSVRLGAQAGPGILEEAEVQGCELIAMATHGRAGIRKAIFGSTADKVLRGAHVPLLWHRYHEAP